MQIKPWKKEKCLLTLMFLVSVIVITLIVFLAKDFCFFDDDYFFSTYTPNGGVFEALSFNYNHGGGYIGFFLCRFFAFFIPDLLKVHPCDFTVFNAFIKGVFAIICIMLICRFLNFFYKSKIIFSLGFIYTSIYFFYDVLYNECFLIGVNYNFSRYFFSLIFFSIFWHYIFKNLLIKYPKTNRLKLIGVCACGFIAGTSSEIVFISSTLLSIMIFIYGLLSKKLNLNKNFYLPVLCLFIAIVLFITSKGFQEVTMDRGVYSVAVTFDLLKEFLNIYVFVYFGKFILYWIIFLMLLGFAIYKAYKKNEIQKIILPVLMELSVLLNIFLLIKCGKTFYESGTFWLWHFHIIFIFGMLIQYPLFMVISYLIGNERKKRAGLIKIFSIFFIIFSLILLVNIHKVWNAGSKDLYYKMKNFRKEFYKMEKMFRFYELKGEVPYIPFYITERRINLEMPGNEDKCVKEKFNAFIYHYYPNIYNDKNVSKIYCVSKNAEERFKEKGGNFSEEELTDIKFGRLFDENFVLNNSEGN